MSLSHYLRVCFAYLSSKRELPLFFNFFCVMAKIKWIVLTDNVPVSVDIIVYFENNYLAFSNVVWNDVAIYFSSLSNNIRENETPRVLIWKNFLLLINYITIDNHYFKWDGRRLSLCFIVLYSWHVANLLLLHQHMHI